MSFGSFTGCLRSILAQKWIATVFVLVYLISQVTIGLQIEEIGSVNFLKLQVATYTADAYKLTFAQWQQAGVMPFYHSHLIFDSVHWVWYAVSLAALLALSMNAGGVPESRNFLMVIPFIAGICDLFENTLQHVFLSDPGYATIIDPLPMISAAASITKWSLAVVSLLLIAAYFVRGVGRKS